MERLLFDAFEQVLASRKMMMDQTSLIQPSLIDYNISLKLNLEDIAIIVTLTMFTSSLDFLVLIKLKRRNCLFSDMYYDHLLK